MRALKDVLGRAEEKSNLRSIVVCTALVVALVTVVFGAREFATLFEPDTGGPAPEAVEETVLQADQGGG